MRNNVKEIAADVVTVLAVVGLMVAIKVIAG